MTDQQKTLLLVWGRVTGIGGTERRTIEAVRELVARGIHVVCFVGTKEASLLADGMIAAGAEVHTASRWRGLRRLWSRLRPALIITYGLRPSLAVRSRRVVAGSSTQVIMARNGLDFGWRPWMHAADRWTQRAVDSYLVNSRAVATALAERGIVREKIIHLPSALPGEWTAPAVTRTGPLVVAMVGNDRPEKNQIAGLRAFARLPNTTLLRIYTDDGSRLRAELAPELAPRVEILEGQLVGPETLDEVDVVLHPSLSESLPRVVLEALARQCVVVATDTGDVAEWIDPRYLVRVPTEEALVDALLVALADARSGRSPVTRAVPTTAWYVDRLLEHASTVAP